MVKKVKAVSPWHNGTTPLEELSPNDQLAHQMVSDYIELMPSVTRIMDAPMTDDERHGAHRLPGLPRQGRRPQP